MDDTAILGSIAKQYGGALAMLRRAIELCPEELWVDRGYRNPFWHIAYHALFYAELYVQVSEAEFRPWAKHKEGTRLLGRVSREELAGLAYAKADVLEYCDHCCAEVAARVPETRLEADSGFDWLPFNKFELHLYNLRHIQHHTGQLTERLRQACDVGVGWVR